MIGTENIKFMPNWCIIPQTVLCINAGQMAFKMQLPQIVLMRCAPLAIEIHLTSCNTELIGMRRWSSVTSYTLSTRLSAYCLLCRTLVVRSPGVTVMSLKHWLLPQIKLSWHKLSSCCPELIIQTGVSASCMASTPPTCSVLILNYRGEIRRHRDTPFGF